MNNYNKQRRDNAATSRKTAIFGGTFNPVHTGHVQSALHVKEEFHLDRVFFIPSRTPVHKLISDDPGPEKRLQMVTMALAPFPSLLPSPVEVNADRPSFTIDTVNFFKQCFPDDLFYFILGTDSFNTLRSWQKYHAIADCITFIVINRPDEGLDETLLAEVPRVLVAHNKNLPVSSTEIRKQVREKKDCTQYMDDAVLDYIYRKELYQR